MLMGRAQKRINGELIIRLPFNRPPVSLQHNSLQHNGYKPSCPLESPRLPSNRYKPLPPILPATHLSLAITPMLGDHGLGIGLRLLGAIISHLLQPQLLVFTAYDQFLRHQVFTNKLLCQSHAALLARQIFSTHEPAGLICQLRAQLLEHQVKKSTNPTWS